MKTLLVTTILILLSQTACQTSMSRLTGSSTKAGSGAEMAGLEKKVLLKDRVIDARNEQAEAEKSFQTALNNFKALYSDRSKDLEKKYRSLQYAYEDSLKNADSVRKSTRQIEPLAEELFKDWENEIDKIETVSLKAQSRQSLAESRNNYAIMETQFKTSEEKMIPVLKKFNDQVHYLKYNLDSKSLDAVKEDNKIIQNEMERLILDLRKSIASADQFVKKMPTD